MKKLFLLVLGIFLFASVNDKYLDFVNKLVTYHFELKNIEKIKSPFFKVKKIYFLKNKKILNKNVKKIMHITLLSILNNVAYIKIDEYMGDELIKSYKKWVKKNDKIESCKVVNIYSDKLILKCNKKILVKKLNIKSLKIKVEK